MQTRPEVVVIQLLLRYGSETYSSAKVIVGLPWCQMNSKIKIYFGQEQFLTAKMAAKRISQSS